MNRNREWRKKWERWVGGDGVCCCYLGETLDKKHFWPLYIIKHVLTNNVLWYTVWNFFVFPAISHEIRWHSWFSDSACTKYCLVVFNTHSHLIFSKSSLGVIDKIIEFNGFPVNRKSTAISFFNAHSINTGILISILFLSHYLHFYIYCS